MTKFSVCNLGAVTAIALASFVLSGQPGVAASTDATAASKAPTPEASSKKFGNWSVSCRMVKAKQDPKATDEAAADDKADADKPADAAPTQHCEMVQTLTQNETGKRVLTLSIQEQDDGIVLLMVTPFGLDLAQQVRLNNGDKAVMSGAFRTCMPSGCIVKTGLSKAMQDDLAETKELTVELPRLDGAEALKVVFPNLGFADAIADLTQD